MNIKSDIEDVKIVTRKRFGDKLGVFSELFQSERAYVDGIKVEFVQDNYSHSVEAGTLCGLHFQIPPIAQVKMVTVSQRAILNVAVDSQENSSTPGLDVAIDWPIPGKEVILSGKDQQLSRFKDFRTYFD